MNGKICSGCSVILTDENTCRRKTGRQADKLRATCRVCDRVSVNLWRAAHPEKIAAAALKAHEIRVADPEKARAKDRAWTAANPEKVQAQNRRRLDNFHARILFFKTERPCYDCGGAFPPESMDFDHVFGTKSFEISKGQIRSWDAIREEIDKCQVVCSNCHRVRTKARRNTPGGNASRPNITK